MAGITPHPIHREARPSRATRAAALLCGLLLVLPVQATIASEARAAEPSRLLTVPRFGEFQPVRGDNFLAWQQNSRSNPDQYDVYARSLDDGKTFKVNPRGTNGANGDIDGDRLVYQQFHGGRSDLRFFDLVARDHSNPPPGVNTNQWEYWPSMSGDWLLFGRVYDNGLRRIILFDLSDNTSRRLDQSQRGGSFLDLAPGQVDGDYAVWYKCTSNRDCDVFRYHIPDGTEEKIPNRGGRQHAPSVTPDGTVFFARSRAGCGTGVRLVRRPLEGKAIVLTSLPAGDDIGSTRAYVNSQGVTTVAYDHFECGEPASSDAFEIGEDFSPELTVQLEGNGSGTVTSSPAGIDCGTDCSESYDMGTGVTLTAEPIGDAAFAGWSGACTGTGSTCTLQMNGSRAVTATFTNNPVLTVAKSGTGQGTVTSSPPGINCGTDCNQPYDRGTNVTLTAEPNQNSVFGGWSGACGGNSTTCNVAMTDSKSVTATFVLKPQLTVVNSGAGDGSVTSSPAGINCEPDCSERYEAGIFGHAHGRSCGRFLVRRVVGRNLQRSHVHRDGQSGPNGDCNVHIQARVDRFHARRRVSDQQSGRHRLPRRLQRRLQLRDRCHADCRSGSGLESGVMGRWRMLRIAALPASSDMNASKSVTATFVAKPVLTVSTPGDGSVTSSPGDIACPGDCSDNFVVGTDVTLTADPDLGFAFDQWGGDCAGSSPTCLLDMDSSKLVSATFIARFDLDVTIGGDGTGSVTSSPGNINCPATPCSDTYDDGTQVTLTAVPGNETTLVFWSGDCTSTTLTTCTVDMDGDRSVTATFDDTLVLPIDPTMSEILRSKAR